MKTLEERYRKLHEENLRLKSENKMLRLSHGELSSDDQSWLQMKVESQRKALDTLNRKVLSQRFRLRTLNVMGRDLTKDEYLAARDAIENEQVQKRIEDYAPIA